MEIIRASLAQISDARLLLEEYYEAVDVVKRDSPEEIADYLSDDRGGLWIAYEESVPVGCVVLRPLLAAEAAAECKRLYVRPEFRGRGIAEALLNAMEEYALVRGVGWIYLDSYDDLKAAIRIYLRRGYEACERYNDNPQATVFLRKNLRDAS
jgi:GNAT superfamily N-acetyltransferase